MSDLRSTTSPLQLTSELRKFIQHTSPAQLPLWEAERELWTPRATITRDAVGSICGASLTAGRPLSSYRKIVSAVSTDTAAWRACVEAARDDTPPVNALHPAPLVIHFEEHTGRAPLTNWQQEILAELGFQSQEIPWRSIPSTIPGDATHAHAWSYWRVASPAAIPRYYGQTTEVTCGAVASLLAQTALALPTFGEELRENRRAEIAFWRRATNLPACEPVGLAVETAKEQLAAHPLPEVFLSTSEPVLIADFADAPEERMLREDLQQQAREEAREMGIPLRHEWISAAEIADRVAAGEQALLLIDLTELIADPTPHWVLASQVVQGADGTPNLLISDPWVHYPNAETWVDTFALPLPLESVERVTRWGDPAYRGVIFLAGKAGGATATA